jgi:uncharacterized protein YkwD
MPPRSPLGSWYAKTQTTNTPFNAKKRIMKNKSEVRSSSEGELHFVKGNVYQPKKNTPRKLGRIIKTVGTIVVGLVILGFFALNWGNFVIQLIMPHFADTTQVENDIFRLINVERANRGLSILLKDVALTTIALEWSKHLAETGNLTHGDFSSRVTQIGYSEYSCGEIIAMYGGWTPDLGRQFVDMWLHSTGHYAVMMTASSGFMGVGVAKGFFAVVDFRFT